MCNVDPLCLWPERLGFQIEETLTPSARARPDFPECLQFAVLLPERFRVFHLRRQRWALHSPANSSDIGQTAYRGIRNLQKDTKCFLHEAKMKRGKPREMGRSWIRKRLLFQLEPDQKYDRCGAARMGCHRVGRRLASGSLKTCVPQFGPPMLRKMRGESESPLVAFAVRVFERVRTSRWVFIYWNLILTFFVGFM